MLPEAALAATISSEVPTAWSCGQPRSSSTGTSKNPPPAPMIVPKVPSTTPSKTNATRASRSMLKGLHGAERLGVSGPDALAALTVQALHPVQARRLGELALV